MPSAITIQTVSKHFGPLVALDNVSFTVEPGEFFALLGPNGAGKTTLISALAGLSRPSNGSISIMGYDVERDFRKARTNLGVVPQELVFDPFLSVRETLRFQSGYFGLKRNDAWIDELLSKLGLSDKADANMRALSGGMSVSVIPGGCLRHRYSSTSLRISLLHVEFYPPLTHSSLAVSNAVPRLSPGLSHQTCKTACARFTPSNSD